VWIQRNPQLDSSITPLLSIAKDKHVSSLEEYQPFRFRNGAFALMTRLDRAEKNSGFYETLVQILIVPEIMVRGRCPHEQIKPRQALDN